MVQTEINCVGTQLPQKLRLLHEVRNTKLLYEIQSFDIFSFEKTDIGKRVVYLFISWPIPFIPCSRLGGLTTRKPFLYHFRVQETKIF